MISFDKVTVLDGATGKNLQKAGMPPGVCPEKWMLEHPEALLSLQTAYIAAGTEILYAPTFGANRIKLEKYGLERSLESINAGLVAISKKAAGNRAAVAGNMTTFGEFQRPFGSFSFEDFVSVYKEQAEALEKAGVDLFVIETLMSLCEARAALLAVKSVSDKPVLVSFTFEQSGRTLNGSDPAALLVTMQEMGAAAFGVNCSTGPALVLSVLERLSGFARIPLIAKPNAGLPAQNNIGEDIYPVSPEEMAGYAQKFADLGVRLFGGCCGTDATHIAALAKAAKTAELKPRSISCGTVTATERAATRHDGLPAAPEAAACGAGLPEAGDTMLHLRIDSEDDIRLLEENQFLFSRAPCFSSNSEVLLENALRVFNGRAFFTGQGDSGRLARVYGAIKLR